MLRAQAASDGELWRTVLKGIHQHQALPLKDRLRAMMALDGMHAYTRATEHKERCVITGRGNGLVRGWRVSRIVWRDAAIHGNIAGVREAYKEVDPSRVSKSVK